ncbi:hypothetical protein CIHG_05282 [Coccidioides immitis H538.4]|uniref:Uncharacterized protein n=3 Tax=Coccidioides immitis TaxID=5501 RepID=A0A0J8R1Q7_COCIT|nr:hypothetical protein CIRG_08348 [Coccidioides immitis RMSCC 2394]KMU78666.1 hypothetical protein CISG_01706 [Coccidioides immitis RMSCC 3703]KMU87486.1 hypothetical protein CIHG_05282 [Coccidioides immitis H538.4]
MNAYTEYGGRSRTKADYLGAQIKVCSDLWCPNNVAVRSVLASVYHARSSSGFLLGCIQRFKEAVLPVHKCMPWEPKEARLWNARHGGPGPQKTWTVPATPVLSKATPR